MRKLFGFIAAAALVVAGAANAAPVQKTVQETLTLEILNVGTLSIAGTGTVSVDTVAGTLKMPNQILSLTTTVVFPVTTTTAVNAVIAKKGLGKAAGTWSIGGATAQAGTGEICGATVPLGSACVGGGGLGGAVPLVGTISVDVGIVIPINLVAANVGVGGYATAGGMGTFKFEAAPWTTGTGKVGITSTTTMTNFFLGTTFTMTNTFNVVTTVSGTGDLTELAGAQSSQLTLVSPTFVSALGNILPVIASNSFHVVVPEPGTILLVVSGVGGLALLGRRRRR